MKLKNPFTTDTRKMYIDCWSCFMCGGNGQDCGGLELHHITGRDSNSPYNASVLCKKCHSKVGHTKEEEKYLFQRNQKHLKGQEYFPTNDDFIFIIKHPYLV